MTKIQSEAIEIQNRLGSLIGRERVLLNEILDLIIVADQQRLYLELGFPSLFEWLTRHFKYSESAAKRRIDSARLKKSVPAIDEKIESGTVNLSTISKTQSAIRAEELRTNTKITDARKIELIEKIEGKSGFETEKILAAEFPETQIFAKERVRITNSKEVIVQILMSETEYEAFSRAKELLSHSVPNGSPGKVVAWLSQEYLRRKDPLCTTKTDEKPNNRAGSAADPELRSTTNLMTDLITGTHMVHGRSEMKLEFSHASSSDVQIEVSELNGNALSQLNSLQLKLQEIDSAQLKSQESISRRSNSTHSKVESRSRYIPSPVRHAVFLRDKSECQAKHPVTGEICGSRYQIQIDHIQPWACGGLNTLENLRCLCSQHNRRRAETTFGRRR